MSYDSAPSFGLDSDCEMCDFSAQQNNRPNSLGRNSCKRMCHLSSCRPVARGSLGPPGNPPQEKF